MKVKIRSATKRDIDVIVDLNGKMADYHNRIDKYYKPGSQRDKVFKKYLSGIIQKRNFKVFIAEVDKKPVGYFFVMIQKANPFFAHKYIGKISDGFIETKYRRLGIGKMLLDESMKWFKKNKIKRVELTVDSRNKIGIKAWQKFGFKEFKKNMKKEI